MRPGEGEGGSDRIEVIWPDGVIKNTWLQVILKGNDASDTNTGLIDSDVFYFGNLVGDTFVGTPPMSFLTNAADEIGVRGHGGFLLPVTNAYDFNKDMVINVADEVFARTNIGYLFRIDLPGGRPVPTPAALAATGASAAVDPSGEAVAAALALPARASGLPAGGRAAPVGVVVSPPVARRAETTFARRWADAWQAAAMDVLDAADEADALDDEVLTALLLRR